MVSGWLSGADGGTLLGISSWLSGADGGTLLRVSGWLLGADGGTLLGFPTGFLAPMVVRSSGF
jgi:hypothetical protein